MNEEKKQDEKVNKNPEKKDDVVDLDNTKSKQEQTTTQSQINETNIEYSGFWVRGAGYIIDGFIVFLLSIIIAVPTAFIVGFVTALTGSVFLSAIGQMFTTFVSLAVVWGYFVFMTHKYQATLGKMAIGVKVVADDGATKLTLGKITLRETVGKFVSSLIFGVGYVVAAFTQKKQGLHDFIAGSTVVYKNPQKGANMVVVIIAYIAWAILSFIMFIIILLFSAAIVAMFAGALHLDKNKDKYLDNFEDKIMQEMNDEYDYDDMFDMQDNSGMMMNNGNSSMPMNIESAEDLEQMLQNLDINMSDNL